MSKKQEFSLGNIDFAKVQDDIGLMRIFIGFAYAYPKHGKQLFDKYVDFLCQSNPNKTRQDLEKVAASNIGYMTGYYKNSTREKLLSVYKMISHPLYGRAR